MSHHNQTHTGHEIKLPMQSQLTAAFLEHMHDTELWASHIPRVPIGLYLLAIFGFALGAASFTALLPTSPLLKFPTLTIGLILILPALFARHFAVSKWNYVSSVRKQIFDTLALRG